MSYCDDGGGDDDGGGGGSDGDDSQHWNHPDEQTYVNQKPDLNQCSIVYPIQLSPNES
jgi:hypothetical protein